MEAQLDELLDFVLDPKPEVRQLATQHILDFTGATTLEQPEFKTYFDSRGVKIVDQFIKVIIDDWYDFPISAHNAISALTNLSAKDHIVTEFTKYPEFIKHCIKMITIPTTVLADPVCMLLSNLSKNEQVAVTLLKIENSVEDLTDVFVKGSQKLYNKHAEFHFLASVFANVTQFEFARRYFLEKSERDRLLPITRLMVFTEHPNIIRRGGVISAIKNCCFDSKYHLTLLNETGESDILPYLLLPLCGPEPFDDDDQEGMPTDLMLLPDDKKRESDPKLRATLVESLVLLTGTKDSRQALRDRKVYPVIRELHKFESGLSQPYQNCLDQMDALVNMLMRDEERTVIEPKVEEIIEDEEDLAIEEIV
ncbi:DUF383-domain-containing protein [Neoconidiobolus thromboides FSU 785]|nr:DUF383-domain-containing protein [Neoconidiobolus thromboides FSU 785]